MFNLSFKENAKKILEKHIFVKTNDELSWVEKESLILNAMNEYAEFVVKNNEKHLKMINLSKTASLLAENKLRNDFNSFSDEFYNNEVFDKNGNYKPEYQEKFNEYYDFFYNFINNIN